MNDDRVGTLRPFRHDIYECFQRSRDALFNTVDALERQEREEKSNIEDFK